MNRQQFLGLIGFLFSAAWIGFGFGDAVLCLLGAAVFYGVGAFLAGELDLTEVQERFGGGAGSSGGAGSPYAPPATGRPRVR